MYSGSLGGAVDETLMLPGLFYQTVLRRAGFQDESFL